MGARFLSSSALFCALTAPVFAQDVIELDEIIISGGLAPVEAARYGRSVSVITRDEIAERGIRTLQDALRAVPGVAVNSTGDSFTQVRIRGGEGNHVLVLIDGVEANTGSGGEYILSGLSLTDIARIEVLRGPQSTIYGPNAVSGVISITTRRAEVDGFTYGFGLEYGSNNTRAANTWLSQRFERGEINFSADLRHTDGEDGSRLDGGDTEFNDRETYNLTGEFDLTDQITVGMSLRHTNQHYGIEETLPWGVTSPTPEGYLVESDRNIERTESFGSLWLEAQNASGTMRHRLSYSGTDQDSDGFGGASSSDSTHRAFKYLGSFSLDGTAVETAAHRLNVLLESEEQTYQASFAPGGVFERRSDAVALEYLGELENGLNLQAGLRRDLNDTFEDSTTWNLSASYWLPNRDIRLRAAAGRAFVNPTMFEQFGFVPGTFSGNPNLKPEESLSFEVGADFGLGDRGSFGVTLYRNDVDNLIQGSGNTSVNIDGTSKSSGIEIEADYAVLDSLNLNGTYTYTDAKTATGAVQVRRPRHELRLSAVADAFNGRGTLGLDLRHVADNTGRQFFTTGTPVETLPSFTTVDFSVTYDLSDTTQLTGRVTNLFNDDYQEAWGYYGNGRELFIGLNASF